MLRHEPRGVPLRTSPAHATVPPITRRPGTAGLVERTDPRVRQPLGPCFSSWTSRETSENCGDDIASAGTGFQVVGRAGQEVDAIIGHAGDWRGEMLSRLRGIVLAADLAMDEDVKWKKPSRPEGVPVWSVGGIVCIGEMLKNSVRLTFPKGAQLKDPKQLFNARLDSKSVRAIDFHEGGKLPEADVKALVLEAVRLNS
jgi:hypothetical protein